MKIDLEPLALALMFAVLVSRGCDKCAADESRAAYLRCFADHPAEVCAPLAPGPAHD